MGCRQAAGTKDLTWPLWIQLERHLLEGEELFGASYDLAKAFDQLPLGNTGFLWDVMDRLRFPKVISNLMRDMYANLVRRFKFNGFLGEPISSNGLRGALQGCAFSMIAMNITSLLWFHAVRSGFSEANLSFAKASVQQELGEHLPWNELLSTLSASGLDSVRQGGYADDLHVASCSKPGVCRAHRMTVLWAAALRMKLNASKSIALGNVELNIGNQTLQCVSNATILGDVISFKHEEDVGLPSMPDARTTTCNARLARIAKLPGTKQDRLDAIALTAIPLLFGGEFSSLDPELCAKLRVRIWEAVRGGAGRPQKACMEVLMTIFCKGHLVDPVQFLDYRSLLTVASLARLDQQSQQDLVFLWNQYQRGDLAPDQCLGPISLVRKILLSLHWRWSSPLQLIDSQGHDWTLPLNKVAKAQFGHQVREDLRQSELSKATTRNRFGGRGINARADMQGVELGVNFQQTRHLAGFLTDYECGVLQAIVSGGINTQERSFRHKSKGVSSPICPFHPQCGLNNLQETRRHRWWECPAWEHLRPSWFQDYRQHLDNEPACFVQCAIAVATYTGPAIDKVQRVYLDIQLAVNAATNLNQPGEQLPPPPPPAHTPFRRVRGKQTVQHGPQPDPLRHPPDCVVMEIDRLSCTRCGRNVQRSHATSVRQFWESRCYANLGGVHLRAVARSVALWNKVKEEHQSIVNQLSDEHGHPLQWGGEKYSSIRCTKCEWRAPLFDLTVRRSNTKPWRLCVLVIRNKLLLPLNS
eukprot:Skav233968  [mRNA]  locus=scaffold1008:488878:491145:- [translate_table: standard]